jgi:hypothetical protein
MISYVAWHEPLMESKHNPFEPEKQANYDQSKQDA